MDYLGKRGLLNEGTDEGRRQFYLSDSTDTFQFLCQKALKHEYPAEIIDIERY